MVTTETRTVDGLAVRCLDIESPRSSATVLMTSPWPESLLAFRRLWPTLTPLARVVAVDLPGFGHSPGRPELFRPSAMAEFLHTLITEWKLDRPHLLAPDVGTSAALFLAARHPESVTSLIVGSGATAYPLDVSGTLADLIAAPDIEGFRAMDIRASIGATVEPVAPRATEPEVWEDYVTSYEDGRFAESTRYVRSYPDELPVLADLLPRITTPVLVVSADHDALVPPSNGRFLDDRLPHSRLVRFDSGHFPWEENASEYATVIADWITNGRE
jgi:pimeloyl-ACP methyl ester carboxylesterase